MGDTYYNNKRMIIECKSLIFSVYKCFAGFFVFQVYQLHVHTFYLVAY